MYVFTFAVTLDIKAEDVLSLLPVDQLTETAAQVAGFLASIVGPVRQIDLRTPLNALGH
jgi:hypothetical protein